MTQALDNLTLAVKNANDAVIEELRRTFPPDSWIHVRAQSNHIHPSRVQVIAYAGGQEGSMRVKFSGGHYTTVSYRDVVTVDQ